MATHSSVLAWRITRTGEPGELPSVGSHRVGHVKRLSRSSREYIEKQRYYFANKGPSSQGYGFSSSYVWIWELDCEES